MAVDGLEVYKVSGNVAGMYVFTTVGVRFKSNGTPTPTDEPITLDLSVENGKFVGEIIVGEETTDIGGNEDEITPGERDCRTIDVPVGTSEVKFKVKGFNDDINETKLTVKLPILKRWFDDRVW